MIGTYKITNIETGIYYYGSSIEVNKRFKRHQKELKQNKHHCIYLQRAYNKYGESKFTFELDEEFDTEKEARDHEQHTLDTVKDLYNTSRSASGGDLISNHPNKDEIVTKIKKSLNQKYSLMTAEEKKKKFGRSGSENGMYGKTHTDVVKKKLSDINKGKTRKLGIKSSKETKQKLSEIAKKRTGTKNPFYGKKHTEETKKKISQKNKGRLPANTLEIMINDVEYISLAEASRQLNIPVPTICYRLKSKNYSLYEYK